MRSAARLLPSTGPPRTPFELRGVGLAGCLRSPDQTGAPRMELPWRGSERLDRGIANRLHLHRIVRRVRGDAVLWRSGHAASSSSAGGRFHRRVRRIRDGVGCVDQQPPQQHVGTSGSWRAVAPLRLWYFVCLREIVLPSKELVAFAYLPSIGGAHKLVVEPDSGKRDLSTASRRRYRYRNYLQVA